MIKINIFFQDLKEDTQGKVWQVVQKELLSRGEVEYKQEDETEEEFSQRLEEETDYYINCHNLANEFCL
tara:strand:+ start:792 stop:998 length:207 start_codon:yes stop_codon:yes gene_type:complete